MRTRSSSPPLHAALCIIAIAAALALVRDTAAATNCSDPNAAMSIILSHRVGDPSPLSEFANLVNYLPGMQEALKNHTYGKAMIVPSNHAVQQLYKKHGLPLRISQVLAVKKPHMSAIVVRRMLKTVLNNVMTRDAFFQEMHKGKQPAGSWCNVVAITDSMESKGSARASVINLPGQLVPNQNAYAGPLPESAGTARKLLATIAATGNGVGTGYDIFKGFPSTFSDSGTDEGLFRNSPFLITSTSFTPTNAGSSCTATTSTSATFSSQQLQNSLAVSLGVSGSDTQGLFSGSFSLNAAYSSLTQTSSSSAAVTFQQGSLAALMTYTLNAPNTMALNSGFATYIQQIGSAPDYNTAATYCNAVYTFFGTHYLSQVVTGGKLNSIYQMTASSYYSLTTQSIDLNTEATATYAGAGGTVTGSYDSSVANQIKEASITGSFKYQLTPAYPAPTLTPSTGSSAPQPNCPAWASAIASSGTVGYIQYNLVAITTILDQNPQLFTALGMTTAQVTQAKTFLAQYYSSCTSNGLGCTAASSTCTAGFWSNNGICQSCYTNGPNGVNCLPGVACSASTGACASSDTFSDGLQITYFQNGWGDCLTNNGGGGGGRNTVMFPLYYGTETACNGCYGTSSHVCGAWSPGSSTCAGASPPPRCNVLLSQSQISTTAFPGINTVTIGVSPGNLYALQYTGYWKPIASGYYWFAITYCDDYCYMWMDIPATADGTGKAATGVLSSQPLLNNAVASAVCCTGAAQAGYSGPYYLLAGYYYPIRVQFGQKTGPANLEFGIVKQSTAATIGSANFPNYGSKQGIDSNTMWSAYGSFLRAASGLSSSADPYYSSLNPGSAVGTQSGFSSTVSIVG